MADSHTVPSPQRSKLGKSDSFKSAGKQLDDGGGTGGQGRVMSKPPASAQPPVHARHVGRVQHPKNQQEGGRASQIPEPPRRAKSSPVPTPNAPPPKHAPPPASYSPSVLHRHPPTASLPVTSKRLAAPGLPQTASVEPAKQRLVDRAIKARLYLLHQSGPNRFLIGGDSPDSRWHVTIGPQNCSCNRVSCVHLLFVMLRVLKVSQTDPKLWQKQLRNYETESLLREFQARVSMRTTPKRTYRRQMTFPFKREGGRLAHELAKASSTDDQGLPKGETKEERREPPSTTEPPKSPSEEEGLKEGEGEGEEEDVCPICLNELDEGEDLLTCSGCHNKLHQHCMDIWAGEERRKNEEVHCPVCRAIWSLSSRDASPSTMPVSVPVGGKDVPVGGLRLKSISPAHLGLTGDQIQLLNQLKAQFGPGPTEHLYSPDWKARESSVVHLSREAVTFLLPQVTRRPQSLVGATTQAAREVQELCLKVVAHSCTDSVLKVFLAALELMRVILGYSVCYTQADALQLQSLLKPTIFVLMTRCADAQRRVKECSIDTICNFCLGLDGPLSVGSACGHRSEFAVTDIHFVMECALSGEDDMRHSWSWWLGRVNFLDQVISRFSAEFLLQNCSVDPVFRSDTESDDAGSITALDSLASIPESQVETEPGQGAEGMEPRPNVESSLGSVNGLELTYTLPGRLTPSPDSLTMAQTNLLIRAWYFVAKATHVPHHKLGKVSRRVIVRLAKVLRDDPLSLEIVHDVISKCHRTSAEGLLDRVLRVREKANSMDKSVAVSPMSPLDVERGEQRGGVSPSLPRRVLSMEQPPSRIAVQDVESSILAASVETLQMRTTSASSSVSHGHHHPDTIAEEGGELVHSDDSYRSAVSDLEEDDRGRHRERERVVGRPDSAGEVSSSATSSHDSKSGEGPQSKSSPEEGSVASGSSVPPRFPQYYRYTRQSTADSAFSTDFDSSLETPSVGYYCKKNIEEEEAEAEAKVRSMIPEDPPHPLLSGMAPPTPEVIIHMQRNQKEGEEEEGAEETDSDSLYLEGVHWVKGRLIGTGAFCSCFLARDVKNGTMFAVKQVSYVRNTIEQQEEELRRLRDEVSMLARLNHPNIVRCLGATQHDGHINIFVEWMAGGCLDQLLHDFGPFAESVICDYTRQIVHGIVYLHEHSIIHRDLKGGNILVDSTGRRLRIADFGAAARLTANTTGPGEFQDMEGTVAFMAPEVVKGGAFDDLAGQTSGYGRKCDVWSIGCVIIQMATAKLPWIGGSKVTNKYQLIFKIGQATSPPPLPDFNSPALKDLTIRCLEIRPEDRPTSSELLKHPLFTAG